MEMGKHIIVFITAILMPFMAYGADCSKGTEETCKTLPGCGWSGFYTCDPCGYSQYNAGGGNTGCIDCTNAPQDATYISLEDIQANGWSNKLVVTGLTSNTCPWTMDVTMSVSYLSIEHPDIPVTLSNVDVVDTTDNETKLVIKTSNENEIFSTISKSFNNNQIDSVVIQLNGNNIPCTKNSMGYDNKQWKLVCNTDYSLSKTEISSLTLTVTAKEFQYVLLPMNSVEYDNDITIGIDKNTSDVVTGTKFGETVTLSSNTKYNQYNNCTYSEKDSTINCDYDTMLEGQSNQIRYTFTYIDKDTYGDPTIIVLERATGCQAGKYCPTYTTNDDAPCPPAFWSDKNAIRKKDCYLDEDVIFIDNNNKTNSVRLIPEGTKVYYRGNSNK